LSNWVLGASISALAGALIAPITYLQPTLLVMLVIPALAVGLLANFASFPIVFLAAAGLGIAEALTARYVTAPGWSQSIAFLIVIAVMVMRGRGIPLRSHVLDRLASVGSGRVRPIPIIVLFVILCVLYITVLPTPWLNAFTVTVGFSLLCLSIVLVTGYAGQLSLAQYVLAGAGGLVAARLMSELQWPFLLAVLGSVVITAGIGLIVALPALRTRGINLAVVTLGLGVVVFNVVLNNTDISGGTSGIPIPKLNVFGFNLSGILYPERYVTAATVLLFVVGIALLNLRRGAAGRRLLAVRSNERASAAMGVSVVGSKLYAFSTGAAIAALAGVVLTFRSASVVTIHFDPFSSITAVAMTVIGGVGYVGGGVLGGTLMPSGVGSELFSGIEGIDTWLPLISGLMLLFILVREPSGLWQMNAQMAQSLIERVRKPFAARSRMASDERLQRASDADNADVAVERVPAQVLTVDGVRVSFGAVVAVANATLTVEPGQVHGLIGPNGAGKTTVIDALTGFVRAESGTVRIGDIDLTKLSPQRRVKAGLGRSFQSLELLEDLTIRENLAIASERWRNSKYFTDLVAPGRIELTGTALAAAREFGLMNKLDLKPGALSMGQRRLAAIARAAASSPSILCLDEPAAGLSDPEAQHLALLLRRLANEWGMGILLVEHNIDMVLAACDKITVLTAGSVLVSGDPQAVRHDPRVLSAYLGGDQSDDSADLTARVN
jgi:sulfate-transporting ATPase